MSKNTRIFSALLVLVMLISTLASLSLLPVFADEVTDTEDQEESAVEENKYLTVEESIEAYLTDVYESAQDKLDRDKNLKLRLTRGVYEFYLNELTAEIALKNTVTGQVLLSNPYDLATVANDTVKAELLSQVVVTFKDLAQSGASRTMYSYTDSASRGQLNIKNVKNGVRVEYTVGKESARRLVPMWIEATRFQQQILLHIEDLSTRTRMKAFYSLQDPNDATKTETVIQEIQEKYKCTKKVHYSEDYNQEIEFKTGIENYYFPAGGQMAIYVIDPETVKGERELNMLEGWIKMHCPHYNYDELQYDHSLTEPEIEANDAAIFKLSIEYYLSEDGLEYRLPANGIIYDETKYRLTDISLLQYFGASSSDTKGYTFIPDGSGTIIRNEDIAADGKGYTITGELYGNDFAYHTLRGNGKSEIMRVPVFGVVEDTIFYNKDNVIGQELAFDEKGNPIYETLAEELVTAILDDKGNPTSDSFGRPLFQLIDDPTVRAIQVKNEEKTEEKRKELEESGAFDVPEGEEPPSYDVFDYFVIDYQGNKIQMVVDVYEQYTIPQGFTAIITEGDALTTITSNHGGNVLHKYNSVYCSFNPRPSDTYNLSDAISVGSNAEWTVVSERKYTGSYRVKIEMLYQDGGSYEFDSSTGEKKTHTYYEASYLGMALTYSDFLVETGVLSPITNAKDQIPLFIETFGMIETQEAVMTMPVWVDTELTTFEDMKKMYGSLSEKGITNVNFRLSGFTDGGMQGTLYPTTVTFEEVLGGDDGYTEFLKFAKDKGIGVYPDFDFANVNGTSMFDKFNFTNWTVKTIDDRYSSKRYYDATFQAFSFSMSTCVSPSFYMDIFERFSKAIDELGYNGISVGTLGSDLNSDFDEDDPYNREDSKAHTIELLEALYDKYGKLMVDSGNAYTWKYASSILNLALDGSKYLRASQAVPFTGIVLHGYVAIAGTPTNESGDIYNEVLKIVENGANPYFLLSAQNTSLLKESFLLSGYYSVNFDTWFDDLVNVYTVLNNSLADLQQVKIVDHKFVGLDTGDDITATRILSAAEQEEFDADYAAALEKYNEDKAHAELRYNNLVVRTKRAAEAAGLPVLERDIASLELSEEDFAALTLADYVDTDSKDLFDAAGNQIYYAIVYTGYEYEEFEYVSGLNSGISEGSVIYMEYADGSVILLNYNTYAVEVKIGDAVYHIAEAGSTELLEDNATPTYGDTAHIISDTYETDEEGNSVPTGKIVTYYGFMRIAKPNVNS